MAYLRDYVRRWWKIAAAKPRYPHGPAGIAMAGHRAYVGDRWDEIGRLQLDFLVEKGLSPRHVLLDIGCGALRAGAWLIPYLEAGHYVGVDKEEALIVAGLTRELDPAVVAERRPHLIVSDDFSFQSLPLAPDVAIAQSLFTHLTPSQIARCFSGLRMVARPHLRFFASWLETRHPLPNPRRPHDHLTWYYTRRQIERLAGEAGWVSVYLGHWGHPRHVMTEFLPTP